MRYTILLDPDVEDGGFTVTVPTLPGIVTQGDSFEHALERAREAIQAHVAGLRACGDEVPLEDAPPLLATIEVEIEATAEFGAAR